MVNNHSFFDRQKGSDYSLSNAERISLSSALGGLKGSKAGLGASAGFWSSCGAAGGAGGVVGCTGGTGG
jgi:hypothetical protein